MNYKAIIEMPKGTHFKYEVEKYTNIFRIDRALNQAIPENYGFIRHTLAPDGDALDVFVFTKEPVACLTEVTIEVVGGLQCLDSGVADDKILAVIKGTSSYLVSDVNPVINYLKTYKTGFEILKQLNTHESKQLVDFYSDRA